MISHKICLISDSTGETLDSLVRAVLAQFPEHKFEVEPYPEVRTQGQLNFILDKNPQGFELLLYTFANEKLSNTAKQIATQNNIAYIDVLNPIITQFSMIFGIKPKEAPGGQHHLSEEYFMRISAIDFTLNHDDGLGFNTIENADVILLGVSRSSKSPTAAYLANRGVKCANIPYVDENSIPKQLYQLTKPLIIGLVKNPEELAEIRKNRLLVMNQNSGSDYADIDKISQELRDFKKLCRQNNWHIMDVSHRSIEETSAVIIRKLRDHKEKQAQEQSQ